MLKQIVRDSLITAGLLGLAIILMLIFPGRQQDVVNNASSFLIEMALILPAVMILMGLFGVWVPQRVVGKYLGKASGLRGMLLAFVIGALPTGPLYVAFPLASGLRKKGTSITNIVIFLSAWACIKLPQEIVEYQFLGLKFMLIRLISTIVLVSLMAVAVDKMYEKIGRSQVNG